MHLWQRGTSWTFQFRVPADMKDMFGHTPLRVRMGHLGAREARRRARLLAGHAEETFMAARRRGKSSGGTGSDRTELVERMARIAQLDEIPSSLEELTAMLRAVGSKLEENDSFQNALDAALATIRGTRSASSREPDQDLEARLAALEAAIGTSATPAEGNQPKGEKHSRATLDTPLSEVATPIIQSRREALEGGTRKRNRYADRIETSLAAFLDIMGDKPVGEYVPNDLQDFANILARIPSNLPKRGRRFSGMSLREVARYNDGLRRPLPRMSKATIESYVAEVRSTWRRATAAIPGAPDIASMRITMPGAASRSIKREANETQNLNVWLSDAAASPEPHRHWMPLVGLLSGMRLGEMVFVQGRDFKRRGGHWSIDLREPLFLDGFEEARSIKNENSYRIVAIHELLVELGFVEWARARRGFIFEQLHSARDPADAASKRMAYWMRKLGIHAPRREVFHSLRHFTKNWLRPHVGARTADLQCGHVPSSVGDRYGSWLLQPAEVAAVATAPLPEGIDFSCYKAGRTK